MTETPEQITKRHFCRSIENYLSHLLVAANEIPPLNPRIVIRRGELRISGDDDKQQGDSLLLRLSVKGNTIRLTSAEWLYCVQTIYRLLHKPNRFPEPQKQTLIKEIKNYDTAQNIDR